ncbi:MAG: rRNA maturation RNase YbeY [Patescibacteria group bacterium]
MHTESLSITNKTKSTLPRVPFAKIKNAILGEKYELSLVFIGETTSKKLNNNYREKNKPTNILSFTVDKNSGEIFITPSVAKKQYKSFEKRYDEFIAFLFIHGLLHLKGMEHGSKMERAEEKWCKVFKI